MYIGKELEAHWVEKGRLSCDSYAPGVLGPTGHKLNRRKTNRRKTGPYSICLLGLLTSVTGGS